MSYFCAAVHPEKLDFASLSQIVKDSVPETYFDEDTLVAGDGVALANWQLEKVVRDVFVRDDRSGSWLCLIGTPAMFDLPRDERLIKRFLTAPKTFLAEDIDGHFALFAWDAEQRTFYAAADANATVPIFWTEINGSAVFASSELCLARYCRKEADAFGCWQALMLGWCLGETTRFKDIAHIDTAQLLVFKPGAAVLRENYLPPDQIEPWTGPLPEIAERWTGQLRAVIKSWFDQSGCATISSDLTAGEDSRLLVAVCLDLGLPIKVRVQGFEDTRDVKISRQIAAALGFDLEVIPGALMTQERFRRDIRRIAQATDGYGSLFSAAMGAASNERPREYDFVHLCGAPGGGTFRGEYYFRSGVIAPGVQKHCRDRWLLDWKFLMDLQPSLFKTDYSERFYAFVRAQLDGLDHLDGGTKVDHLVRVIAYPGMGVGLKRPFYRPLGVTCMTRSFYALAAKTKADSLLTRFCTEKLHPRLARMKTQRGVPTIPLTPGNLHLFIPGYVETARNAMVGVLKRKLKWQFAEKFSTKTVTHYVHDYHADSLRTLFAEQSPYRDWFVDAGQMRLAAVCAPQRLQEIFSRAMNGHAGNVRLLGKLVNLEFALRYVNGD